MKSRKARQSDYSFIKKVYQESFPLLERQPLWLLWYRQSPNWAECQIFENEFVEKVGFAYIVHHEESCVIQYLAVCSQYRSKGYGSKILQHLQSHLPYRTIWIEIESLHIPSHNITERQRRESFYLRHGFKKSGFISHYVVSFDLLVYGDHMDIAQYVNITRKFLLGLYTPRIERIPL